MQKQLLHRINNIETFIATEKGRRKEIKRQLKKKKEQVKALKNNSSELDKCILLLDHIVKDTEGKIVELFESTVSAALKDIFDDSYEFRFNFGKRGNLSTCEYEIKSLEHPVWDNIIMTRGKSVAQVIAAVLRIILVKIDKNSADIVVLDEPLDGLEPERKSVAAKFLHDLCQTFGIQLIMITHGKEFIDYADEVLTV